MMPKQTPETNQFGDNVTAHIPAAVDGVFDMPDAHRAIWQLARTYLGVRDNDAHTLYAYGIARELCRANPEANPDVVLPAILLHDTGWSQVPEDLVLAAITPSGGDPELVAWHEREGVCIAGEILTEVGVDPALRAEIADIIAEHDSLKSAKSLNDALVKDADKVWRVTPHGIDTVMEWFGLDRAHASRLCAMRVHSALHTDAGRQMARGFSAIASVDWWPERRELG